MWLVFFSFSFCFLFLQFRHMCGVMRYCLCCSLHSLFRIICTFYNNSCICIFVSRETCTHACIFVSVYSHIHALTHQQAEASQFGRVDWCGDQRKPHYDHIGVHVKGVHSAWFTPYHIAPHDMTSHFSPYLTHMFLFCSDRIFFVLCEIMFFDSFINLSSRHTHMHTIVSSNPPHFLEYCWPCLLAAHSITRVLTSI